MNYRVDEQTGCWIWMGSRGRDGYGRIGKSGAAHRVSYEQHVGPIPEGLELDHLCRVRACVNPAHLEPVTHRENVLRGEGPPAIHARKTHCVNGHPFDAENTTTERTPWGVKRVCRICRKDRKDRFEERRRLAKAAAAEEKAA